MKNRLLRGLEKPKDTGFVKFIQSVVKCAQEEVFNIRIFQQDWKVLFLQITNIDTFLKKS